MSGKLTEIKVARQAIRYAYGRLVDCDLINIFGEEPVSDAELQIQALGRDAAVRTMEAKFPFLKAGRQALSPVTGGMDE